MFNCLERMKNEFKYENPTDKNFSLTDKDQIELNH